MQPEDRIPANLWDMRDAARELVAFAAGKTIEDLFSDRMFRMAVERELEIVGEAARRIPTAFCRAHPEILWSDLIGRRNVLAHDYGAVRLDLLWKAIAVDIPAIVEPLDNILVDFEKELASPCEP